MLVRYDADVDALYVSFGPIGPGQATRTVELDERRRVDYDQDDSPIGVEILSASTGIDLTNVPRAGEIRRALKAVTSLAA